MILLYEYAAFHISFPDHISTLPVASYLYEYGNRSGFGMLPHCKSQVQTKTTKSSGVTTGSPR